MSEVLVHVTRGNSVENIHRGDMVVVDSSGSIIARAGNPYKASFMRSCSKPIQASAVLESGAAEHFGISEREISVMCASHYGEDFHVEAVRSILDKIGLSEDCFKCGPAYSLNEKIMETQIRSGMERRRIANNCSGKHAGMLALAVKEGFDTATYDQPDNPVQQRMLETVADYSQMKKEDIGIGIDGCGVPVFEMPLYNMALAFTKFADTSLLEGKRKVAAEKIVKAMTAYPEMIAGTDGFCSELMRHTHGKLIGKLGADGVYCIGIVGRGIGLAVKIEDGNTKVLSSAVLEALRQLRLIEDSELQALSAFYIKDNINSLGQKVGEIKPVFTLEFGE